MCSDSALKTRRLTRSDLQGILLLLCHGAWLVGEQSLVALVTILICFISRCLDIVACISITVESFKIETDWDERRVVHSNK